MKIDLGGRSAWGGGTVLPSSFKQVDGALLDGGVTTIGPEKAASIEPGPEAPAISAIPRPETSQTIATTANPLDAIEATVDERLPKARVNGSNGHKSSEVTEAFGDDVLHERRDCRYRLRRLLAIADIGALAAAFALSEGAATLVGSSHVLLEHAYLLPALFVSWLVIAALTGAYHMDERRLECTAADEVGGIFRVASLYGWVVLCASTIVASAGAGIAPAMAWAALAIPTVVFGRSLTRSLARRRPWYREKVLLVGSRDDAFAVARRIDRHPEWGVGVIGRVDIFPGRFSNAERIGLYTDIPICPETSPGHHSNYGLPPEAGYVERVRALLFFAERYDVDRVIFASSPEGLDERTGVIRLLCERGVKVDLVPGGSESYRANSELHHIEGLPLLTLPSARKPRSGLAVKRAVDVTASLTALLVLSPLFAYCAFRIKRDSPGPVFFRQRRIGYSGKEIEILKFRTMVDGADQQKEHVAGLNHHGDGLMFKIPQDPRVTNFGAKLRRASLDELPQLWNVLRGDMSLVGPRPLIPEEANEITGHHRARFNLRPGITGRWQVLGRSDIPFEDMVKLDYTYVTNWSLGEDLRLLAHTADAIVGGRGAY